jgi:hypothetical protein
LSKTTWRGGSAWRVTTEDGGVLTVAGEESVVTGVGLAACVLDTGTTGVT